MGSSDCTTRNNYRLAQDQDRCKQVRMCRCHQREEFVPNLAACKGGRACYIVATVQILPLLPGPLAAYESPQLVKRASDAFTSAARGSCGAHDGGHVGGRS